MLENKKESLSFYFFNENCLEEKVILIGYFPKNQKIMKRWWVVKYTSELLNSRNELLCIGKINENDSLVTKKEIKFLNNIDGN